jgi:hypothetical protein
MAPQTVVHRPASPGTEAGFVPFGATTLISGSAASATMASDHIAPIQPKAWISFCRIGAKMNWPKEPPALITPEAAARDSTGRRCAVAPISTEKLPMPEPIAESRPRLTTRPKVLSMNGVSALPAARISRPQSSTLPGP